MMQWDRLTLGRMAKELGFPRDTLEKVCRLADVLKFMESDELLAEGIALKGGTASNLTIFDLPRLSVDIDLDYFMDEAALSLGGDQRIFRDLFRRAEYVTVSLEECWVKIMRPRGKNYTSQELLDKLLNLFSQVI